VLVCVRLAAFDLAFPISHPPPAPIAAPAIAARVIFRSANVASSYARKPRPKPAAAPMPAPINVHLMIVAVFECFRTGDWANPEAACVRTSAAARTADERALRVTFDLP